MPKDHPSVPKSLRAELDEDTLGPIMVSAGVILAQGGYDLDFIVSYIQGAREHQNRLARVADKKTAFEVTITDVSVFERKGGSGFTLGKKARVHFEDKSGKEDSLDTEWIEYNGFDDQQAFAVSLANTLMRAAEDMIGKKAFISKTYIEGVETKHSSDGKVKFLSNIEPSFSSAAKDEPAPKGRSARKEEEDEEKDDESDDPISDALQSSKKAAIQDLNNDDFYQVLDSLSDLAEKGKRSKTYKSLSEEIGKDDLSSIMDAVLDEDWVDAAILYKELVL